MDSAVHVLLRYKLLDILSGVLDVATHPARQTISQVPMTNLPTKVQHVSTGHLSISLLYQYLVVTNIFVQLDTLHRCFPQDHAERKLICQQTIPRNIFVGIIIFIGNIIVRFLISTCVLFCFLIGILVITISCFTISGTTRLPDRNAKPHHCHPSLTRCQLPQNYDQRSLPRLCIVLVWHGKSAHRTTCSSFS